MILFLFFPLPVPSDSSKLIFFYYFSLAPDFRIK